MRRSRGKSVFRAARGKAVLPDRRLPPMPCSPSGRDSPLVSNARCARAWPTRSPAATLRGASRQTGRRGDRSPRALALRFQAGYSLPPARIFHTPHESARDCRRRCQEAPWGSAPLPTPPDIGPYSECEISGLVGRVPRSQINPRPRKSAPATEDCAVCRQRSSGTFQLISAREVGNLKAGGGARKEKGDPAPRRSPCGQVQHEVRPRCSPFASACHPPRPF